MGFLSGVLNGTLKKVKGNFHTFGCDILIDSNFNPWFIEPNAWPGIEYAQDDVKDPAVKLLARSVVNFVMDMYDNWKYMDIMLEHGVYKRSIGQFQTVYNEATNYNIL